MKGDGSSLPALAVALGAEAEVGPVPRRKSNSGMYFVIGWSLAAALLFRSIRTILASFTPLRTVMAAAQPSVRGRDALRAG